MLLLATQKSLNDWYFAGVFCDVYIIFFCTIRQSIKYFVVLIRFKDKFIEDLGVFLAK